MKLVYVLLLSFVCASSSDAQTTSPRAAAAAAASLTVSVTDGKGTPLRGVAVRAAGPVDREGVTDATGTLRFDGLRSGVYRLRFVRDEFITLERDVIVPARQRRLEQHVMLSVLDKPAAPPPAETPAAAPLPPPGKAVTVSVPDFVERNLITGAQPQKTSAIACSGLVQTVLWQVRDPWENRQHPTADATVYVVAGEGTLKMGASDVPLEAGTFVSVPRGTTYALTRRGRNPLIVLATLAGEPCAP